MDAKQDFEAEERLIRLPEVMKMTSLARSTVWHLAKNGSFPQPIRLSPKITVWRAGEIQDWIKSRIRDSANKYQAAG